MNRPYSQTELLRLDENVKIRYRLSDIFAVHSPCMHRYRVKKGGRKEESILCNRISGDDTSSPSMNDLTCSVCFKLRTSVDEVPSEADIKWIGKNDGNVASATIRDVNLKANFYRWLYRHDYN